MTERKKLRTTRPTERAGVNAVRAFLEDRGCVVQEVDTANDFGKDLLVDLTEKNEITGQSIAVQVKSGISFFRNGIWGIPAKGVDLNTWLESSIPIFGIIFDPVASELHWMNLSAYVHEEMDARYEHKHIGRPVDEGRDRLKGHFVAFPRKQLLELETWDAFSSTVGDYGRRFGGHSLLNLAASDPAAQLTAVHDCFALGRGDARPLLLLRYTISHLCEWALMAAITALSHCGSHPDIAWSERNWIPQSVRNQVKNTFKWSPEELHHMIRGLEISAAWDFSVWERGGYGQSFIVLLWDSPEICESLREALRLACDNSDSDVAFRALLIYLYFLGRKKPENDLMATVTSILASRPSLAGNRNAGELVSLIEEFGWIDLF